jgi:hypothetical protein
LTVGKDFVITERQRLNFRAEAFNLTNTPSFGNPDRAVNSAAFGAITTLFNSPRNVQLALKYFF